MAKNRLCSTPYKVTVRGLLPYIEDYIDYIEDFIDYIEDYIKDCPLIKMTQRGLAQIILED